MQASASANVFSTPSAFLEKEAAWRDALARVLQTTANIIPIVPRYAKFPFAATIGAMDPMWLYAVFDDRYFMASTELNVINTLLLAGSGG